MKREEFIHRANDWGETGRPFLFLVDFEMENLFLSPLEDLPDPRRREVLYFLCGSRNYPLPAAVAGKTRLRLSPMPYERYAQAFHLVMEQILAGNSYLLNLTFPTEIDLDSSLLQLFHVAQAPYKLYFRDQFVVFSPECFVRTSADTIYSYPMKGTIDADLPGARQLLMENQKEEWEHNTIVDLIRNDLAVVSRNIEVTRFRFVTKIRTNRKSLLQVSSEIRGDLPPDWRTRVGHLLIDLLPAGSISGAPKKKTLEIIRKAEKLHRGYFTGVFGIFDGRDLNSAVNIRFIEKNNGKWWFRSGGGITSRSRAADEYQEMLDKVYVPTR